MKFLLNLCLFLGAISSLHAKTICTAFCISDLSKAKYISPVIGAGSDRSNAVKELRESCSNTNGEKGIASPYSSMVNNKGVVTFDGSELGSEEAREMLFNCIDL